MNKEVFAIVEHFQGFVDVSLAEGDELAVHAFIQSARIIADLLPGGVVAFHGQDVAFGLPYMTMTIDGYTMVSLQPTKQYGGQNLSGYPARIKLTPLPEIGNCSSFYGIAAWLNWLYEEPATNIRERLEKVSKTLEAISIRRDFDQVILGAAKESDKKSRDAKPSGARGILRAAVDGINITAEPHAKAAG